MPAPIQPASGFGQRLKQLRRDQNLTQQDLARKAGIHYTHISKYEAEKSMPAVDTLRRLAEALRTTTDYLMDGATEDSAKARLSDKALLQRFADVEALPEREKAIVMELLDAFLAMHQLKNYTSRAG
jgi:transcriptional regulator with XRE-family HTH domain